jgi:hypothetical protein
MDITIIRILFVILVYRLVPFAWIQQIFVLYVKLVTSFTQVHVSKNV